MGLQSDASKQHHIIVCTTCRHKAAACAPGLELIEKLRAAIALAERSGAAPDFSVSGIACMAGCTRPCTVAFRASGKATYLFGDVDPKDDIDALVDFASQFEATSDGWTKASERPAALADKTLARIPAAITIAREGALQ